MSGADNAANKRQQDRKNLIYFPRVFTPDAEEFGRVVDITTEGMLVVRYNPTPQMGEYKLTVKWIAEDGCEDELSVTAQVRWCKQDVNPDLWAVGLKFTSLDAFAKTEIHRLIRKWSFPEW